MHQIRVAVSLNLRNTRGLLILRSETTLRLRLRHFISLGSRSFISVIILISRVWVLPVHDLNHGLSFPGHMHPITSPSWPLPALISHSLTRALAYSLSLTSSFACSLFLITPRFQSHFFLHDLHLTSFGSRVLSLTSFPRVLSLCVSPIHSYFHFPGIDSLFNLSLPPTHTRIIFSFPLPLSGLSSFLPLRDTLYTF